MVYIKTIAYNAEQTIARAIESIINQTYVEWRLYILDNGSNDNTGEIIKQYALKDLRIVPFFAEVNYDGQINKELWNLEYNIENDDYFAILDADDEYDVEFLHRTIECIEKNNADMVICGTVMRNIEDNTILQKRLFEKELVIENKEHYNQNFIEMYPHLCAVWAKLYRGKVAKKRYSRFNGPEKFAYAYGSDTLNVFECIKECERIVVLNEILHTYYVGKKTISNQWIEGRMQCARQIYDRTQQFLQEKAGLISEDNQSFIKGIFMNNAVGSIDVLLKSDLLYVEKLEELENFLQDELWRQCMVQEMSKEGYTKERKATIMYHIIDGLIENADAITDKESIKLVKIFKLCGFDIFSLVDENVFGSYVYFAKSVIKSLIRGERLETLEAIKFVFNNSDGNMTSVFKQDLVKLYECLQLV